MNICLTALNTPLVIALSIFEANMEETAEPTQNRSADRHEFEKDEEPCWLKDIPSFPNAVIQAQVDPEADDRVLELLRE